MINSRFLRTRIGNEKEDDINFSLQDFYLIRDYIYENAGIHLSENKKDFLENRLRKRVKENNFKSFQDYYYFLKYNNIDREFKILMDAITINETKFFRNLPLLGTFENLLTGEISENKKKTFDRNLKILSAGCATGEEPYTLSMILNDNKDKLRNLNPRITAGDISMGALESAKKGIYKDTQLRSTETKYIKKYFIPTEEKRYKIDPSLRMIIDFKYVNLSDFNGLKRLGKFDVIFCRNVMIYFDNDFKKKLVKTYYDMLNDGGYFFIGHSESLFGINNDFKMRSVNGNVVYQKNK